MRKVKLTITELKREKDALKRFQRFLPMLILKKQNLQIELFKIKRALREKCERLDMLMKEFNEWIAVLGEDAGIGDLIQIHMIEQEGVNIAGVDVPLLRAVRFREIPYDLYVAPLWFDRAIEEIQKIMTLRSEISFMRRQAYCLQEELRTTTQRVNLFEKVKIPQTRDNIRVIRIFLGDQQTAAVARGKISKGKIRHKASAMSL